VRRDGSCGRLLDHARFPWFRNATISSLCAVKMPAKGHLYWTDPDIDLETESIRHPEDYPLVANQDGEKFPRMA
jgi:hypothetical protein